MKIFTLELKRILPEEFLRKAHFLGEMGINEYAWTAKDAIYLINILNSKGIHILGGDVYLLEDQKITHTYNNWNISKEDYLPSKKEIDDSKIKSIDYIENYVTRYGGHFLFSIVPYFR